MRLTSIFLINLLISALPVLAEEFRVVHYNIKELDSVKIKQGQKNGQVSAALKVIQKLKPDFLSINEIQYDLKDVPSSEFQSQGQNMSAFVNLLSFSWNPENIGFGYSNTGLLAKKIPGSQEYATDTQKRELSDPINFGVFPSEYSVGGATRFKVLNTMVEQRLKWKEFKPDRDLSQFKDANGLPLDQDNIELFDKNFTDMTVKINNRVVHFILFHTVPSHDFDNEGSPNSTMEL